MRIMLLPLMLMACGDKTEDSATAVEEQEQAASEEQAQQSEEGTSEQAE